MRSRIVFSALFALVTAIVTLALAQPRGRGAPPRPKPKTQDASVEAPAPEDAAAAGSMGGSGSTPPLGSPGADGGAAPTSPALPPSYYDGGQKPSPLNPAPNELAGSQAGSQAGPPAGAPPQTVDYDKLLGDISTLRARVATVGDALFHSRIAIAVQADGDHAPIARMTVSLDEGVVYTAPQSFRAEDMTVVYDHAVAPGRHAVTVDVERKDDREEAFRNAQRSRFIVDVPKDQRLSLEIKVLDDSSMGAEFPGDRSGKYDLRVRVRAIARPVTK